VKKYFPYGVLLATLSSISISSSSLSLNIKDTRPTTEPPKAATQAVLAMIQTILLLCPLARSHYINEKGRQIHGWSFDDLALLKPIKDNAIRLWSIHRQDRKVIRLEEWKRELSS
jgi:hypothetical protein